MAANNFNNGFPSATNTNFNELAIDFTESIAEDSESEVNQVPDYDTFLLYARSENASDREIAFREVSRLVQLLNYEKDHRKIEVIFSLVENVFVKEKDSKLFGMLVDQIPSLYVEFMALEHLMIRSHRVFPELITNALEHPFDDVRKSAISAADILVEQRLLPQECLQNVICPTLFDQCYCPDEYSQYVSDEQRAQSAKACVSILGKLAIMFGEKFTEEFAVPFVMSLSKDSIWGVRKCSLEVFVDISYSCSVETRTQILAPRYVALTSDTSRWVINTAYHSIGRFIATFADAEQIRLAIRDGRLVNANSDLAENNESVAVVSNTDNDNAETVMDADDLDTYDELPPGVVLPEADEDSNSESSTQLQDERSILNELTSLLDTWALSDGSITSQVSYSFNSMDSVEGGVAASCSTHSDLTKLVFDDEDDSDSDVDSGEDDDREESPCPMEIEDDDEDIKIIFEEPSSRMEDDDNMGNYEQFMYWSTGYCDVDLYAYGKVGSRKKKTKKRVAEFIQRHSETLFWTPEQPGNNAEITNGKLPEEQNSEQRMEEDEDPEADTVSHKLNKTFTVECSTQSSGDLDEKIGENEQAPSPADAKIGRKMLVPQALVDSFVKMVADPSDDKSGDVNRECAHTFPAVVFTLGRRNWPLITESYKQLSTDAEVVVRSTLASSMHEVAAIIGEENTEVDLLPIFEHYMNDIEVVKIGLLKHLYDFLKLVKPSTRIRVLSGLPNFLQSDTDTGRNWRYRHEFVRQCILLYDLFDVHDVNQYLAAIALTLANDRISDVRKEATVLLAKILGKFVREEWIPQCNNSTSTDVSPAPITDSFVNDIVKGFARSMNWLRRQTFALFCEKSLEGEVLNYDQFSSLLLDDLLRLSEDPVANVRLGFARALLKTRGGRAFRNLRDSTTVRRSLELLLNDKDIDCRRAARNSLGMPDTESIIDAGYYAQRIRETEEFVTIKYNTDQIMSSPNRDANSETV